MEHVSLLPKREPTTTYGLGGYTGNCCDRAIYADNPAMLRECVDLGFIDEASEMLDGKTVLQFCVGAFQPWAQVGSGHYVKSGPMRPRAPKCAEMLRGLGWMVPEKKAEAFGIR